MSDENTTGPWADDLRSALGEEHGSAFDAVDGYLRERWQPRVTELEQQVAPEPARELWKDLNEDAGSTLAGLVHHVYGEDFYSKFAGLFDEGDGEAAPAETPAAPPAETPAAPPADEVPEWAKPILDDYQSRAEAKQAEERSTEYDKAKNELFAAHTDLTDDDRDLIDAFIYGANGDMELGYQAYQGFQQRFRERVGAPAPEAPQPPSAPPVLGDSGQPAPPTSPKFEKFSDLDKAFDAWADRQAATQTPPPVAG